MQINEHNTVAYLKANSTLLPLTSKREVFEAMKHASDGNLGPGRSELIDTIGMFI